MEFIPLEGSGNKNRKGFIGKKKSNGEKNVKGDDDKSEISAMKGKLKGQVRGFEKKKVKNKYKETLAMKQKKRVPKKKTPEEKEKENEEEEEEEEGNDQTNEEHEVEEETTEDEPNDEEIYKKKCREMDEKKKNRLFVKLKKKILNEAQIKELHPDIRSVIFPRKKNSRWCWAVFASEERADEAMKKLIKNKEVLVSKPTPYDKVEKKNKEKMKTVLRKKEGRKKFQKMWM